MPSENKLLALAALFFSALILCPIFFQGSRFAGSLPGHAIGLAGTALMGLTLIYPYRKHVRKQKGRQNPLTTHVYAGLAGPALIAVHAGQGFESLIGTLAFLAMVAIVLSGLVGTYLFKRVNRTLKEQKADLLTLRRIFAKWKRETLACQRYFGLEEPDWLERNFSSYPSEDVFDLRARERCEGLLSMARSMAELEYGMQIYSTAKELFSRWMKLHLLLAILLGAVLAVHVLTTFYYGWQWLR